MRIIEIIRSLLPLGTDGNSLALDSEGKLKPSEIQHDLCPVWPPDVFAVTGTIIERSSCYTHAGPDRVSHSRHIVFLEWVEKAAQSWSRPSGLFDPPKSVKFAWKTLLDHGHVQLSEVAANKTLLDALFELFAVADEACIGMGWDTFTDASIFSDVARDSFIYDPSRKPTLPLPYAPHSLCALVPSELAVVLPKTLTATVGCTIRSLSHHLALLPGITQVKPSWAMISQEAATDDPINLLLVPFPFRVPPGCFGMTVDSQPLNSTATTAAYFAVQQKWLAAGDGSAITAKMLFQDFLGPLIANAKLASGGNIDGLIVPECAFSDDVATQLAIYLFDTGIQCFVTGVLKEGTDGKTRNIARTYIIDKPNNAVAVLEQYKHHRWRLDRSQLKSYGIEAEFKAASKATTKWWEHIDISARKLPFFAFRPDMSMAVLICEDLARNDPAMAVIRAVGPNLVLALLMDGPQIHGRWPDRYATVLADDPGSSVLSLTCAGMVQRSNAAFPKGDGKIWIGLWGENGKKTRQIELEPGKVGVLLSLRSAVDNQHTLDARSDNFSCQKLTLDNIQQVSIADRPKWL